MRCWALPRITSTSASFLWLTVLCSALYFTAMLSSIGLDIHAIVACQRGGSRNWCVSYAAIFAWPGNRVQHSMINSASGSGSGKIVCKHWTRAPVALKSQCWQLSDLFVQTTTKIEAMSIWLGLHCHFQDQLINIFFHQFDCQIVYAIKWWHT